MLQFKIMAERNHDLVEVQLGQGGEILKVDRQQLAKRLKIISQCAKLLGRRPGEPCPEGCGMSLEWMHTIEKVKQLSQP